MPRLRFLLPTLLCMGMLAGTARAEDLVLYGAGSLREAMGAIAADFAAAHHITIQTQFGPSGLMRERIERGERVDVFTSADMGHPLKLRADGRAVQVAMFTRNTLCATATPEAGLTTTNFLDRLLDPAVKLGTSTPKADPSGDYTWAMFKLADQLRPGSYQTLDGKAQKIVGGSTTTDPSGKDPAMAALASGQVNVMIGYCTSARLRMSQMPGLQSVELPEALAVGPEYGLAVLKDARPGALDLAFYILSPEGQTTLARFGFKPVGLPASPAG